MMFGLENSIKMHPESENYFTKRREPFRFMLNLGLIGSILLFGLVFFVFFARNTHGKIPVPQVFHVSTIVMIASSIALILANNYFFKEDFKKYRITIGFTFIAGILFIILQLVGWNELISKGILLKNNMAAAFLYILSGLHIFHILIGILVLWVSFKSALQNPKYVDAFIYSVNPPNILRLKLVSYYWHFVDLLWLVIYVFFIIKS